MTESKGSSTQSTKLPPKDMVVPTDKMMAGAWDVVKNEKDVAVRLGAVLKFEHDEDYVSAFLFAAQSHIVELLETVFYLAFTGATGSGKGTAVEAVIEMCHEGQILADITGPYLASVMHEGNTIGIEEIDDTWAKSETLRSLLRNGYRRGVPIGKMLPTGKDWEPVEYDTFGPKVFDFHAALESHTAGRCVSILMKRDTSSMAHERTVWATYKRVLLNPVQVWLALRAEKKLKNWNTMKVMNTVSQRLARIKKLGIEAGRPTELANSMLLVADVFGWDLDKEIGVIFAKRALSEPGSVLDNVAHIIKELFKQSKDGEIETISIVERYNAAFESSAQKMTSNHLSHILRDLELAKYRNQARASRPVVVKVTKEWVKTHVD